MQKYIMFWLPAVMLVAILVLASCASPGGAAGDEQGSSEAEDGSMQGMDHTSESVNASEQMLMEDGEYSDERFIDAMVPHHQGAIDMAQVALENAEHQEILTLAQDIASSQENEIEQLKAIKQEQFGTSEVPMAISAEEMQSMGMWMDPQDLANQEPFDKAFIDNMIPHHESAISMANVVLQKSETPEIREIAEAVVEAQEREVAQMKSWREEWYPEG